MKLRFGFLHSGYRKSKFFWEFLIIMRKIIIISCVVFIGNHSIKIQALTIMFTLSLFLFLQFYVKPYNHVDLNRAEMCSILCAAVTMYCGVYYLTRDLDEGSKIFFFCIMIVVNVVFLVYFASKLTYALQDKIIRALPFLRKAFNIPPGNFFPEEPSSREPLSETAHVVDGKKVYTLPSQTYSTDLLFEESALSSTWKGMRSPNQKRTEVSSYESETEELCLKN
mmetsp:Transcript_12154/g.23071  ORF Transcript_12154/g.23071 Transcript_12154/m.23071 type:complete len:224 (-) Transcript_12154:72-743(-)